MSVAHMILIALAGVGAGAINAVVGSGTLITFPTLVALGYPPDHRDDVERRRPGRGRRFGHLGLPARGPVNGC